MNALTAQTEIQTLIETYRQAVIAKDVEKVMALYATDEHWAPFDMMSGTALFDLKP
ncbi:hypothetical protein EMIT0P253_240016 [Pseudomonas sp. IT-P253]|jgi:ketosteroid isomerase-like protein